MSDVNGDTLRQVISEFNANEDLSVAQFEKQLMEQFGALRVELNDAEGRHIHGRRLVRNARELIGSIIIELPLTPEQLEDEACVGAEQHDAEEADYEEDEDYAESEDYEDQADYDEPGQADYDEPGQADCEESGQAAADYAAPQDDYVPPEDRQETYFGTGSDFDSFNNNRGRASIRGPRERSPFERREESPQFNEDFFIREFDRLEKRNGFMWAGFVVKDMIPKFGFDKYQAKHILRQLEAKGIVILKKRPNPKNPEHPTTCLELNREHPRVATVLRSAPSRREGYNLRGRPFPARPPRDRRF